MKKRLFISLAALLAFLVSNANANTISVDDVTLNAGATKAIKLLLPQTSEEIAGFQFDVELPNELTLTKSDDGELFSFDSSAFGDMEINVKLQSDGSYRFMAFSPSLSSISLKGTEAVECKVKADKKVKATTASLKVKNIVLADAYGNATKLSDVISNVTIAPPVKVIAIDKSCQYGDNCDDLDYEMTSCHTSGSPTISCAATASSSVGTYEIIVQKGSLDTDTVTLINGTLTITKAPLTIIAKSYTRKQGEENPTLEATYEGFKNGETEAILIQKPTLTTTATSSSTPGTYDIIVSGAEAENYEISYLSGTLTIEANSFTLTYLLDGEVYKTVSYDYGTIITPEPAPSKEGYTFSGWSGIPETMPANDVMVIGKFTVNKYKLTYMVDGEVYKTVNYDYDSVITPEQDPSKEGYTFSGWSEVPETMPAHDVMVTGSFTKGEYKLTYIVDGEVYKTISYDYEAEVTPEAEPTKEGYTFSGWSEIPETMPAHDVTVTGSFSKGEYKLTYIVDGEVYKTVSYDYEGNVTPEAEPAKEGYTFSGWSEIPETMPAHDVTVTGSFAINKYQLIYIVDGEEYKSYEIEYGATITPIDAPEKEGYTFSGWSKIPETMPAKNVTVVGTFAINKYNLTYIVDGLEYKSYEIEYGAAITPELAPTKEGYTFSGWSDVPETMPAHDVMVTGTFTVNKYKLTYKVDGEVYKTITYDYGTTITPEVEPTKEGYTFSGWSKIPETMPAKDVTVTGTFTINKYKLTYMVDGTVYKSYEVEYGSTITPEAEPTKEGYTFSGWSEIPPTMPAKDVTVNGTFSKGSYKLTYMVDGKVYKTITYDYGATITPEAEPTKEGYTFSGWTGVPATMPAKDVTVTGTFTINKYKLTYMVDGEVYKSYEIEYGSAITPEAEPTKEGYTFSGWSWTPKAMPAEDVTVIGTFSINKYKLTYMVDGEVYESFEIEYGNPITPEEEPVKEGHTFSGWSWIPKKMPNEDVTVSGYFTVNKYKLTYMIGDETYKEVEIEYGSTIPTEPQPDGDYVRFEWVGVPETMPAHDVIVYADFETGIMDVMALHGVRCIYSPNGKRISKLQKGVNVVVMNDGSVKKVYVK